MIRLLLPAPPPPRGCDYDANPIASFLSLFSLSLSLSFSLCLSVLMNVDYCRRTMTHNDWFTLRYHFTFSAGQGLLGLWSHMPVPYLMLDAMMLTAIVTADWTAISKSIDRPSAEVD